MGLIAVIKILNIAMEKILYMDKISKILACPKCLANKFEDRENKIICTHCSEEFDIVEDKPFLLQSSSEIRKEFREILDNQKKPRKSFLSKIPSPSARVWTKKSIRLIKRILIEHQPNHKDKYVLNMGAGSEKIYRKLFKAYDSDIIRVGLPHSGKIDVYGDAMNLPIASGSVDLVMSSSVFEHLKNPEQAASEIFRILNSRGKLYAEIPFMRGFHMAPIDYQRYTIEGIEQLFARHGFKLIEKGICSGTFNAFALILRDFLVGIAPRGFKFITRFVASWFLHWIKYLDRLFENSKWNLNLACNFYYYGEKVDE